MTKPDLGGREPRSVGIVTIGQTPRPDLLAPFAAAATGWMDPLGRRPSPRFVEAGALDGLDEKAVAAMAPRKGETFYVTKLADGRSVKIAVSLLEDALARAVLRIVDDVDVVVIACTGSFPGLHRVLGDDAPLVIEPDQLLKGVVAGIAPRRLAVFVPDEGQREALAAGWERALGRAVTTRALSPYLRYDADGGARRQLRQAINELVEESDPDLFVFDCMAYDEAVLAPLVGRLTSVPTLYSAATVARIVTSMV